MRIVDFIEEVKDEETVDECSKDFFLNNGSDCWKFLLFFYSNTYCLRIADFIEDEIEGAVEDCSKDFFYVESFLTLSPDNSCEDLFSVAFIFQ